MENSDNHFENQEIGKHIRESKEMTSFYSEKSSFQGSETDKAKRRTTKKILL